MTTIEAQHYAILILQVATAAAFLFNSLMLRAMKRRLRQHLDNQMRLLSSHKQISTELHETTRQLKAASKDYTRAYEAIEKKLFLDNHKRITKGGEN